MDTIPLCICHYLQNDRVRGWREGMLCRLALSLMSPDVDFKKWPYRRVEFKGQGLPYILTGLSTKTLQNPTSHTAQTTFTQVCRGRSQGTDRSLAHTLFRITKRTFSQCRTNNTENPPSPSPTPTPTHSQ